MSLTMMCAPVQSGAVAPVIPQAVQGGGAPVRSLSPLSMETELVKTPVATNSIRHRTMTLRFPCKARGVLDNHNARSAYLDVPPDADHGTILICSHPQCRGSGRKFRWCEVCKVPVAKRNFGKRHGHAQLDAPEPLIKDAVDDDVCSDQSLKRQRLNSEGNYFGEAVRAENELVQKEAPKVPKTVIVGAAPSVTDTFVSIGSTETVPSELTAKERRWLELFRKRPKESANQDDLRKWLEAVVATAELKSAGDSSRDEEKSSEARDEENTEEDHHDDDASSVWDMQDLLLFEDADILGGDWACGYD